MKSAIPGLRGLQGFRRQISLRKAMIGTAFFAVGLAAIRYSTYLWLRTINTVVLFYLMFAILAVVQYPKRIRAFWLGFAVFGWGYYYAAFGPWEGWPDPDISNTPFQMVSPDLLSNDLVGLVVRLVSNIPPRQSQGFLIQQSPEYQEHYICAGWIGHLLFTLIFAGIGGIISKQLMIKAEATSSNEAVDKA